MSTLKIKQQILAKYWYLSTRHIPEEWNLKQIFYTYGMNKIT